MAVLVQHFIEPPRTCSYLQDRLASLETKVMIDITPAELEEMLIRGWRRFGPFYFRPACTPCQECVSIRIPTADFTPSKAQRRAKKACGDLRVVLGPPSVDRARLALYHRWHSFREGERGWEGSKLDARGYQMEFAFPHPAARELAYYDDNPASGKAPKLVGVAICDETPKAWSAVYFFYDPDYARRSLGIYNVLYQIDLARQKAIPYIYPGYRIAGCASMRYKSTFRPHELLFTRPALDEAPRWEPGGPLPPEE